MCSYSLFGGRPADGLLAAAASASDFIQYLICACHSSGGIGIGRYAALNLGTQRIKDSNSLFTSSMSSTDGAGPKLRCRNKSVRSCSVPSIAETSLSSTTSLSPLATRMKFKSALDRKGLLPTAARDNGVRLTCSTFLGLCCSKCVAVICPPGGHSYSLVPMLSASIGPADIIALNVGKRTLDCVRVP